MEIGSFIEFGFSNNVDSDYYNKKYGSSKDFDIVKLNTARAGILHSLLSLGLKKILIPYYQCPSLIKFIEANNIEISFYSLDEFLLPMISNQSHETAFLLVNYFGVIDRTVLKKVAKQNLNVIIDNSQAFYCHPIKNSISVYSPRKFFGVPDGCFVIGKNLLDNSKYVQDYSSNTASFLFERVEHGCEKTYKNRTLNEERLDNSPILKMSLLSQSILSNTNYSKIKKSRKANYQYIHSLLSIYNNKEIFHNFSDDCVPMVYPFMYEDIELLEYLKENKIFTGRWWSSVLHRVEANSIEASLSKFMLPIPIDQRYGKEEIDLIVKLIENRINV